jgi:hypothetical protein
MKNPLEKPADEKPIPVYTIICCNTVDELSQKVSAAIIDGPMVLHGKPFVFKDQVCQAIKS